MSPSTPQVGVGAASERGSRHWCDEPGRLARGRCGGCRV